MKLLRKSLFNFFLQHFRNFYQQFYVCNLQRIMSNNAVNVDIIAAAVAKGFALLKII
jgi:hypothetical protein